jgi:hypothetical protein
MGNASLIIHSRVVNETEMLTGREDEEWTFVGRDGISGVV